MILLLIRKWLKRQGESPDVRETEPIEAEVVRIQSGDDDLRNDLLRRYQPYVAKTAARFCKRYINPERDDEFSVALLAFNEAIDAYNPESGRSFLSFAETVIRRRLTDHVRKEQRFSGQVPQSVFVVEDEEGEVFDPVEADESKRQYQKDLESEARIQEIAALEEQMSEYGIAFADLVNASPKHEDTRRSLIGIGFMLARDPDLSAMLEGRKMLPLKELCERVNVSRKTLERGRKYIIAVALIHMGAYPHLRSFVVPPVDTGERAQLVTNQKGGANA